jgi:hypothetical protein
VLVTDGHDVYEVDEVNGAVSVSVLRMLAGRVPPPSGIKIAQSGCPSRPYALCAALHGEPSTVTVRHLSCLPSACLSMEYFRSRHEAVATIETWRKHYNDVRALEFGLPNAERVQERL